MRATRGARRGLWWTAALVLAALVATLGASGVSEAGRPAGAGGLRGPRGPMALARMMPMYCPDFGSAISAWGRSYKRSLYATSAGKQENANRVLAKSREAWYQVLSRYYEHPPAEYAADSHWQGDLAAVTGHLHLGEWLAYAGDMKAAHEALEPVRRIWMDIRTRNGVRWFGDELTRYHDVMEPVVLWGTGQAHGGVTDGNIAEFEAEVAALHEAWQKVARFRFRPRSLRGPGGQLQYGVFMTRSAEAVERLRMAAAERRFDEIPEAALEVRNAFVPLFMNFG